MHQRFVEFLQANPVVIPWLIGEIRRRIARTGSRHVGANMLIEKIRFDLPGVEDPSTRLRVNNDYGPFLSREIARRAPDLADCFETRASRADKDYGLVRWPGTDIVLGDQPAQEPAFPGQPDTAEDSLW